MNNEPNVRRISSAGRPLVGRRPSERSLALAPSALPLSHLQLTMDPPWLSADVYWGDDVVNDLIHLKNEGHVANGKSPFDWKVYLLKLLGYQNFDGGTGVLFWPILKLEGCVKLLIES